MYSHVLTLSTINNAHIIDIKHTLNEKNGPALLLTMH